MVCEQSYQEFRVNRVQVLGALSSSVRSPVGFFLGDNIMDEIWKTIAGFGGMYDVSDRGNVRSWKSGNQPRRADEYHLLTPAIDEMGRKSVSLHHFGKEKRRRVHRLVLLAFVGPCPPGHEVCHNDGDASNNRLSNLRWDTHVSNCHDRKVHGKEKGLFKKGNRARAKISEADVRAIHRIGRSMTLREIASMYPIGATQVSNILLDPNWRNA